MNAVIVYTPHISSRLQYTLAWVLGERLRLPYKLCSNPADAAGKPLVIAYGAILPGAICIPTAPLLLQQGTDVPVPDTGQWQHMPTLYPSANAGYTLPFDILSAVFYLLARCEEYSGYTPDKHGRYPAQASILYQMGILHRPIADEWIHALRLLLQEQWHTRLPVPMYSYRPSYDIDIAYSYLHKGLARTTGAWLRALLKADVAQLRSRMEVIRKKQKDPYDSFRWLRQVHKAYGYRPLYFVLCALRTTPFDKNIHPQHPAMVRIIKQLAREGDMGIHPSYYTDKGNALQAEKHTLEQVAGHTTQLSRQHYIRATMPHTWLQLAANGITHDYSMGYGTHLGFRAGTGSPFFWYNLATDEATTMRIHPFCFMDTTARYEAGLTPAQAFDRLNAMTQLLRETGSTLITVFHNFSLGSDDGWKGWRPAYEHFLAGQQIEQALQNRGVMGLMDKK